MSAAGVAAEMRFIHDVFEVQCQAHPEHVFIEELDRSWTLRQLADMADALEQELIQAGVGAGDRVLVVAENAPQHVGLILACSRLKAWSCGVNARMSRGEIEGITQRCDPRVVYYTSERSAAATQHAQEADARPSGVLGLHVGVSRPGAVAEAEPLASRVASLIFTSGSTGVPKGVMITHQGLIQFAKVSSESRDLRRTDRS